jgi:ribose 5-phosphate isomerase B
MMRIAIGSDHGGFELKEKLLKFLDGSDGYGVKDFGTHSKDSCDYPLIGFEVAKAVSDGEYDRGILVCKSGIGMAIIANKLPGVRAAACYDIELARLSREHNNCNVLVLAASYTDKDKAKDIVKVWLEAEHSGERHARRVEQMRELEEGLKRERKNEPSKKRR